MVSDEVKAWANQRLSSILGIADVSDVAEYLLGIQVCRPLLSRALHDSEQLL